MNYTRTNAERKHVKQQWTRKVFEFRVPFLFGQGLSIHMLVLLVICLYNMTHEITNSRRIGKRIGKRVLFRPDLDKHKEKLIHAVNRKSIHLRRNLSLLVDHS